MTSATEWAGKLRDRANWLARRSLSRRGAKAREGTDLPRLVNWNASVEEARSSVPHSELASLFFAHTGHQIVKCPHYLSAYEEQFGPLKQGIVQSDGTTQPIRMLEIGVSHGGSLQLWRNYFGEEASIWGVDIDERCATLQGDFNIRIGSQADPTFLRAVVKEMGGVDIVLDDGSHVARQQQRSFATLFPLLSVGGVYAVEDLHTAYWPDFGGGYLRPGTFIETVKDLVDDMHAWYHDQGDSQGAAAATSIPKITFYDSIVFITKAQRLPPMQTRVGNASF